MLSTLLARAAANGMVFGRADALELQVSDHDLRCASSRGEVVRVRRDGYVVGAAWREATPEGRLALRARAALVGRSRRAPDEAAPEVATHQSALALHGLPLHGVPLDVVDLAGDVTRTRVRGSLRTHPRSIVPEPVVVDGLHLAAVPLAIVQVALPHGIRPAMVPLDQALRARRCTVAQVRALAAEVDQPGPAARVHELAERCDALSESPGETRTRLLLEDLGFAVRSQVRLSDADGRFLGRVDLLVEEQVVVEFDGLVKYEGAQGREELAREKRREDRIRRLGMTVVRLTWSDLEHPERVAALIREALAR